MAGFLLSAVLGIVTLLKFLKERREAKELASSVSFKAPAEKDRIIIDTTQSAVLVMEQAVRTAREEADRYKGDLLSSRAEVESLKEKLRIKDERIDELEDRLRAIQFELKQAMKELASLREDDRPALP